MGCRYNGNLKIGRIETNKDNGAESFNSKPELIIPDTEKDMKI